MGPTAAGKTETACALCDALDGEIISVDSAMVYRGCDIGTAKPSPNVLRAYPHHLIDICDPSETYSAGRFRADALQIIETVRARGRIAILVGGTGLYFRALEEGIASLPSGDAAVRAGLSKELEDLGLPDLYARLEVLDPASAKRIHPHDRQRICRALEVFTLTGRPLSELHGVAQVPRFPYPVVKFALAPRVRSCLHARIAQRFEAMLVAGFINEVRALRARGDLDLHHSAMRAVGYRAIWRYLDGACDYEEMRRRGTVETRQLAKRQLTWLRRERDVHWFDPAQPNLIDQMLMALKRCIELE